MGIGRGREKIAETLRTRCGQDRQSAGSSAASPESPESPESSFRTYRTLVSPVSPEIHVVFPDWTKADQIQTPVWTRLVRKCILHDLRVAREYMHQASISG